MPASHQHRHDDQAVIDPVCGMRVDPTTAASSVRDGQRYFFCSTRCQERFGRDGESVHPSGPPAMPAARSDTTSAATQTEYVCPMHPEIVRPGPGTCPICGMALEPRLVSTDAVENPELRDMRRRFWISLLPTLLVVFLAMSEMLPGQPVQHTVPDTWLTWT